MGGADGRTVESDGQLALLQRALRGGSMGLRQVRGALSPCAPRKVVEGVSLLLLAADHQLRTDPRNVLRGRESYRRRIEPSRRRAPAGRGDAPRTLLRGERVE